MKKRLFAIALALMLALTLLPVTAYADDEGSADLGTIWHHCRTCNTDSNWKFWNLLNPPSRGMILSIIGSEYNVRIVLG